MKNTIKSMIFSLFVLMLTVTFTSCGDKSEDPTPVTPKTDLELVKAELKGTFTFKSVTVSKNNKTATTSVCQKTELNVAGFPDENWKNITPLPNLIFNTDNNIGYNLPCLNGSPTDNLTWTLLNNNGVIEFSLSNGRVFTINPDDITTNEVKANLKNTDNYIVKYVFTK